MTGVSRSGIFAAGEMEMELLPITSLIPCKAHLQEEYLLIIATVQKSRYSVVQERIGTAGLRRLYGRLFGAHNSRSDRSAKRLSAMLVCGNGMDILPERMSIWL